MDAASSQAERGNPLPDLDTLDLQALKLLLLSKQSELDSRQTEIENLKLLILKLKRMHFGPRSEKFQLDIQQLELRLEDLEANQVAADPPPVSAAEAVRNAKAPRKPARRPLPPELPRDTETIAPKQLDCPDCGGTLRLLGEDVSEVLEYVPARFKVLRTVRPKMSCACCSRIVQEPAPNRVIDRGLAGPGLLAHVLVAKYADHLPLYRQSEMFAREGIDLDRSTLADWVGGASRTLRPLIEALKKYVLNAEKLHGDDVPVPVLAPGNGKTKTGRLWTYVRDDRRQEAMRRRRSGSLTRPTARASIRRGILETTKASCRRMATRDSSSFTKAAALSRQPAGHTSGASFMICTRRIDHRSPKKRWSGLRGCTGLRKISGDGHPRRGSNRGKPYPDRCWNQCRRGCRR